MTSYWHQSLALFIVLVMTRLQAAEPWILREDGIGPIKVGITLAQLNTTLHEKLAKSQDDDQGCFYVTSKKHPHVSFMLLDGRLARIDVDDVGVANSAGVRVGDSEAHVVKVYGSSLKVGPHHYIEDGRYLTIRSSDGRYGTRFETEQGKITTFYSGTFKAIQFVEGCS